LRSGQRKSVFFSTFRSANISLFHYVQINEHPSCSLSLGQRRSVLFTKCRSANICLFHCVQVSEYPSCLLRSGQWTPVFFTTFRSANTRPFHCFQVSEHPSSSLRSVQRTSVFFTTFRSTNIRLFHCVQISEHSSCSSRSGQRTSVLSTTFGSANIRLVHYFQNTAASFVRQNLQTSTTPLHLSWLNVVVMRVWQQHCSGRLAWRTFSSNKTVIAVNHDAVHRMYQCSVLSKWRTATRSRSMSFLLRPHARSNLPFAGCNVTVKRAPAWCRKLLHRISTQKDKVKSTEKDLLRILTHWGRGHLNCLNARYRGF